MFSTRRYTLLVNTGRAAAYNFSTRRVPSSLPACTFQRSAAMSTSVRINGDLNNTEVLRQTNVILSDPAYLHRSLAITKEEDDVAIRSKYRPFLLDPAVTGSDWISSLELSTALKLVDADLAETNGDRIRVLVLYGSLRNR